MSGAVPRELAHFLLLSAQEQANAVYRLSKAGMSVQAISTATRLAPEQIQKILAELNGEPGG